MWRGVLCGIAGCVYYGCMERDVWWGVCNVVLQAGFTVDVWNMMCRQCVLCVCVYIYTIYIC